MYLFFDGVSTQWYLALFNSERKIIAEHNFEISGNESTKTIPLIDEFISSHQVTYEVIENIALVVWPGSFTGIRTISLIVNTLAYIYPHIELTSVNFFDMYHKYPIVKSSSKRDLFVKYHKSATIEIQQNHDFIAWFGGDIIYWDTVSPEINEKYELNNQIDYNTFIKNLVLKTEKRVAPLYIKKPTIS
jgi:hypothetical protein